MKENRGRKKNRKKSYALQNTLRDLNPKSEKVFECLRQVQYLPHTDHVKLPSIQRSEHLNAYYFSSMTMDIICRTSLPTNFMI